MNERIQELAKQATMIKEVVCEGYLGRSYTREEEYFDKEKCAKLIVRECADIVAKRKDQAIDDGWNVDEAMSMAEMDLEEHFGVEE